MQLKRQIACILTGVLVCGMLAGCGAGKDNGQTYFDTQLGYFGFYYKNANGWDFRGFSASAGEFTSLTGDAKSAITSYAVLPEIDGEPVSCIDFSAFSGCTALTSVTIPDSVTVIQWKAFSGCTALVSVTLPETVTNIGNDAFRGCDAMTSITVPESVTVIGTKAIGYRTDGSLTEDFVLFGTPGSAAEDYAKANRITFREAGSQSMPIAPGGLCGDVNGDGKVNSRDARLALRASAKLDSLDGAFEKAADISGDGKTKAADARTILRVAAKLEKITKDILKAV